MSFRLPYFLRSLTCLALLLPFAAGAQTLKSGADAPGPSRIDIYGGYAYFNPHNASIGQYTYQPINTGAVTSISGYFTPHIGMQAEGTFSPHGPNDCVFTAQAGLIYRWQLGRLVPFAHALGGGAKIGGPASQPCTWGWGTTGGLGVDYILPYFHNRLAVRPIQADYHFSQVSYGPLILPAGVTGGFSEINGFRLSAGIVLRLGDMAPPKPVLTTCSVSPSTAIYPGDPITVSANTINLDPKKPAKYTWSATAGHLTPANETAAIDTKGVAPGEYTVKGHVAQGPKPGQMADCEANFTVKKFDIPTTSCSADPASVVAGQSSTITSHAVSPQNRPLSYSYSSTGGEIAGTTSTATLGTNAVAPGTVTVTCSAVDDLGQNAVATTTVTVTAPPQPPPPPAPTSRALCSVAFDRDSKRPTRVDNEAKGCLDDVALTLNREADARLVVVGDSSAGEQPTAAQQRAMNVKQYLTDEKGVDPSRIELRTGSDAGKTVQNNLVPTGATFADPATSTFDASTVKRQGKAYGTPKTATKPTPKKK